MEKIMAGSPSVVIGGNQVQMTERGKMQVTAKSGKIKTLSQDQFKKQLIQNSDKINNGEDFEFKNKSKKNVIIGSIVGAAAVVGLGIAGYKGKLGKGIENFLKSFKKSADKAIDKLKGKATKTSFDKAADKQIKLDLNKEYAKQADVFANQRAAITKEQKESSTAVFKAISDKDTKILNEGNAEDLGKIKGITKRSSLPGASKPVAEPQEFVSNTTLKNKKNHGVTVDPKMKAKWEATPHQQKIKSDKEALAAEKAESKAKPKKAKAEPKAEIEPKIETKPKKKAKPKTEATPVTEA